MAEPSIIALTGTGISPSASVAPPDAVAAQDANEVADNVTEEPNPSFDFDFDLLDSDFEILMNCD
uniref:Uncharacterized protein n=2 Tax=Cajanus cajan TaxID=3821 RepID=A0A151SAC0_CAJCA|nr:hypothetical protein KK1_026292 [Cajanus cajan]